MQGLLSVVVSPGFQEPDHLEEKGICPSDIIYRPLHGPIETKGDHGLTWTDDDDIGGTCDTS